MDTSRCWTAHDCCPRDRWRRRLDRLGAGADHRPTGPGSAAGGGAGRTGLDGRPRIPFHAAFVPDLRAVVGGTRAGLLPGPRTVVACRRSRRCAGWIDPAGRCGRHGGPAVQDREGTPSRPVARPAQRAFAAGHGRFVSFVPFYEDPIGAATAPRPSIGARVSPTTAGTRPRSRRHRRPGRT